MNPQQQQPQGPPIDLKNTSAVKNSEGKSVFLQGVILRKVSKFVAGTDSDALMPIPVFYDTSTGKILESTIPVDLRDEYKDHIIV
jgi:hypothetical protein